MTNIQIEYIKENVFFFSVCKTKEDMRVLSKKILTETGEIKPFYKFHQEVQLIYPKSDWNTLEPEYNLAVACAQMAVRIEDADQNEDRYNLQLRELEGKEFTLLPTDLFWNKYFPPNDWTDNKFFVVQVRKNKYPLSNSEEAQEYMSEKVNSLFQYDFRKGKFPIDRFINFCSK